MTEVEFLPIWYQRKRRLRARLAFWGLVAALPAAGLAGWLWLA